MILYVSRGLLSSLTEAKHVMEVLSVYNAKMDHKVIINTYPVIDGESSIVVKFISVKERIWIKIFFLLFWGSLSQATEVILCFSHIVTNEKYKLCFFEKWY